MKASDIISAYCHIRKIDHTIPDDVLDFMKNAAIEKIALSGSGDHTKLDPELQSFQLWQKGIMLTANLPRMDAISGVKSGIYYVISAQAVGYSVDLRS